MYNSIYNDRPAGPNLVCTIGFAWFLTQNQSFSSYCLGVHHLLHFFLSHANILTDSVVVQDGPLLVLELYNPFINGPINGKGFPPCMELY